MRSVELPRGADRGRLNGTPAKAGAQPAPGNHGRSGRGFRPDARAARGLQPIVRIGPRKYLAAQAFGVADRVRRIIAHLAAAVAGSAHHADNVRIGVAGKFLNLVADAARHPRKGIPGPTPPTE